MRTAPRASIDCMGTEPIVQCRARRRARRRALTEQLHESLGLERLRRRHDQSRKRIKPEPRYQRVTVTKSSQSNVVKLEPSTGPTLFLNRTTTNRSTTVTAIRIQYCASCTISVTKHRGNGKAVYKEALQEIVYRAQLTTLSLRPSSYD